MTLKYIAVILLLPRTFMCVCHTVATDYRKVKSVMTVSLPRNSVHTQFCENQSCDSESKMGTHAHRKHMAW